MLPTDAKFETNCASEDSMGLLARLASQLHRPYCPHKHSLKLSLNFTDRIAPINTL